MITETALTTAVIEVIEETTTPAASATTTAAGMMTLVDVSKTLAIAVGSNTLILSCVCFQIILTNADIHKFSTPNV